MGSKTKKKPVLKCAVCGTKSDYQAWNDGADVEDIRDTGGRLLCKKCRECRSCGRKIRHPRRREGLCPECLKKQRAVRRARRSERATRATHAPLWPVKNSLDKMSRKGFLLKCFARLERVERLRAREFIGRDAALPVVEVGFFYDDAAKHFVRLSQSGVALPTDPEDRSPRLRGVFKRQHRLTMPETSHWSPGVSDYIKRLRARGYRLVWQRDERGHRIRPHGEKSRTIDEWERETRVERLDENLGVRHRERLEKIDRTHDRRALRHDDWTSEAVPAPSLEASAA